MITEVKDDKATYIQKALLDFINEQFMVDLVEENIDLDESLVLNGVIDSTGLIELVTFLETEFLFTITENEITPENFGSVNKIVSFTLGRVPN